MGRLVDIGGVVILFEGVVLEWIGFFFLGRVEGDINWVFVIEEINVGYGRIVFLKLFYESGFKFVFLIFVEEVCFW